MLERIKNWFLCLRFPFLKPRNVWSGDKLDDYNYEFTWLDDIPYGWKKAFGVKLCRDLKRFIKKSDYPLSEYRVMQTKEKFGRLCWYDNGLPKGGYDVLKKYEILSEHTCINCGTHKNVYMIDDGWLSPWCKPCWEKEKKKMKWYENKEFEDFICVTKDEQ